VQLHGIHEPSDVGHEVVGKFNVAGCLTGDPISDRERRAERPPCLQYARYKQDYRRLGLKLYMDRPRSMLAAIE
jgi:hypothetical protein